MPITNLFYGTEPVTPGELLGTCDLCGKAIHAPGDGFTTGFGYVGGSRAGTREIACYACCSVADQCAMIEEGRYALYLTDVPTSVFTGRGVTTREYDAMLGATLTNWPGSLKYPVIGAVVKGRHNMARVRYDVDFVGPDFYVWHGTQYGDQTQVCHVRRTKRMSTLHPEYPKDPAEARYSGEMRNGRGVYVAVVPAH